MNLQFGKKIIVAAVLIIAFIVVSLATFLPQVFESTNAQTIKVAYLPAVQSLPLFTAMEQGMFEEAGLKVEVERIESPNQIIDALVSGKADAGAPSVAAGITAIVDTKNPGAIRVYSLTCGTLKILNDELLVAKDSGLNSISDLKGKRIGHIPGVQFSTMMNKILLENGVNPSEVTLVELPIPNQLATLSSRGVDAVLTLEPTATIGSKKGISRILVPNPMVRYVSDPWCGGAGVVSGKFFRERPEQAEAFIEVMREAIQETKRNPSTKQYLVKYLSLDESVANETPLPLMVSTENIDEKVLDAYQKFASTFYELGVIDKQPNVREIILN
jgi:NitT/TauT family transport system substrate-binding protein